MHRLGCVVVIGTLAVAASAVVAGPAVAAKGGNNDTANLCQHGGWKALVPDAGGTFVNQGDCVNDGAKGSAPFGTAGKAACTDPHGINGSFSLDATNSWTCFYDVPPNPTHPPELQTACDTDAGQRDRGELNTGQEGASPPENFFGVCQVFPT